MTDVQIIHGELAASAREKCVELCPFLCRLAFATETSIHATIEIAVARTASLAVDSAERAGTTTILSNVAPELRQIGSVVPLLGPAILAFQQLPVAMFAVVGRAVLHDPKVFGPVVRPVSIHMMHDLTRLERPAEDLLHNDAMLASPPVVPPDFRRQDDVAVRDSLPVDEVRVVHADAVAIVGFHASILDS
jgi:hypothetical protein